MATSGSYNFDVTALDILTEALELIGVLGIGESIDASESESDLRTLNLMLKSWQSKVGIWLNKEVSLFFEVGKFKYSIGPTGDHCAANAVKTEVATAASSGAASLVIDSTTGMNDTFDRDGIFEAATPSGTAITMGGDLVTNGITTLSGQRKILFFAVADETGRTFSVEGRDSSGNAVTENITGPGLGLTVYSANEYRTITSITVDAGTAGKI